MGDEILVGQAGAVTGHMDRPCPRLATGFADPAAQLGDAQAHLVLARVRQQLPAFVVARQVDQDAGVIRNHLFLAQTADLRRNVIEHRACRIGDEPVAQDHLH